MPAKPERKRKTEIAKLSPETLQRLLIKSLSNHALYLIDLNGAIVSWNDSAELMLGYSRDEATGIAYERFFSEDDRANKVPQNILKLAASGQRSDWEGWRVRKDGERFWAVTNAGAVLDDDGEIIGYSEIARDVTPREGSAWAFGNEKHFRQLVEAVTDYAIYMLDRNGIVMNWNAGAERIKGYRADEIIGRHFGCFYTEEDRAAGRPRKTLEAAERDGRYEGEHVRVRKDGTRFWASVVVDPIRNDKGELIGFAKITRDISERHAAQEALRASERQLRLLVEGVTDYAIYMIDPNGIVTNWNLGAQRIKGYRPSEIIGQHFSRFYTEEDRAAGLPLRSLYAATEQGRFDSEGWRVRKDGSRFWASVVIDAIKDENGKFIGFAKITRDITERREAQEALQRAQEQLAHAQKMEALGQLTGGIAHDFNNLLMVVSGQAALMKKRVSEPKDVRALEAIEYAVSLGARLTRQLLSFGLRQPLNPSAVNLNERVLSFRELLASSVRGNIKLDIVIGDDVWPVFVDPTELELALVNLAVNSRDAMPSGGTIVLSATNRVLGSGDVAEIEGEFVAISVRDNGTGIAADNVARIFEPFFTTKAQGKGTGLGLAQVYGFAKRSGGAVTVSSQLGQGTTMTIYVPRSLGRAAVQAVDKNEAAVEATTGKILVVEDNPDVRAVSATLLEQIGYRVLFAENAEDALNVLVREPNIDLVFSDIVMPGDMDGIGLARAIRVRYPQIAVLLTSGYAKAAETAEREFPILRKPYEVRTLASAVAASIQSQKHAH
jgi:PAS domain S-box-containing protein